MELHGNVEGMNSNNLKGEGPATRTRSRATSGRKNTTNVDADVHDGKIQKLVSHFLMNQKELTGYCSDPDAREKASGNSNKLKRRSKSGKVYKTSLVIGSKCKEVIQITPWE